MKPLLLAGTIAAIAAAPHAALLAQTNATSTVAPTVRVSSNVAGDDSVALPSPTVYSGRDVRDAHAAGTELMGATHNALSRRADDSTHTENVVGGVAIRSVTNGAGFVTLADGTEWQIALVDRPRVQQWRPGDHLIVRFAPITRQPNFDYRLVNGRDKSDALVAFAGIPDTTN